ncbi:MAG: DUF61 family protein [Candidatus Thermoplasmatota archaeon]
MENHTGTMRGIEKYLEYEFKKFHNNIVIKRKSLKELLLEEEPKCITKDGKESYFDKEILKKIAKALPEYRHDELLLPITIYFDLALEHQCYISDKTSAEVLKKIENFLYEYVDGKMYLPESIGIEILNKYKGCVQFFAVM